MRRRHTTPIQLGSDINPPSPARPQSAMARAPQLPRPTLDGGEGEIMFNKNYLTTTTACHKPLELRHDKHAEKQHTGTQSHANAHPDKPTPPQLHALPHPGLNPPTLLSGEPVTGTTKLTLRKENKRRRKAAQGRQLVEPTWWTEHTGQFLQPTSWPPPVQHLNSMVPAGLALDHPAAPLLLKYATEGCPVNTGQPWTLEEMEAAIHQGPHASALAQDAIAAFDIELREKLQKGQARIVNWEDIRQNPPPQLKISPLAMVPHKSRHYRSILDLSFPVKLVDGRKLPSVNSTTVKTGPTGAIDQLGHSLQRIIHAFAQADPNAKIFMAKWDVKDGFWRLDCAQGEEWNFAYVLPTLTPEKIRLVVPTSLQMGWIESPTYFCAASETARDVAEQYMQCPLGTLPAHKFLPLTENNDEFRRLPLTCPEKPLKAVVEVFMDDFIGLAMATSQQQLQHVSNAIMYGIHDVFPPDNDDDNDPISKRKLETSEGTWALQKDILGLTFDGNNKTVWLEQDKRDALITILSGWLRASRAQHTGIPFAEFRSVIAKLRHAFTTIPAGRGLLSPFNRVLAVEPRQVYPHNNKHLRLALEECRIFLRESVATPTKCGSLVSAWPDYIGVKDASSYGVGGIIVGENREVTPTVFRLQWPEDITRSLVSTQNKNGTINNSDLELAGLLLLWIVMEEVCPSLDGAHVALFSDNSPTVHWVERLAARTSPLAMQLLRALALRLQIMRSSPLTPLHIPGIHNAMTDIPSRSFGSDKRWHCKTNADLQRLFNRLFPLPSQASWSVFQISREISTRVISTLRTAAISTGDWRRLPQRGTFTGSIGRPMSGLWAWTLSYRKPGTPCPSEHSPASLQECEQDTTVKDAQSRLQQSVALSRPLARRSPWCGDTTQLKPTAPATNSYPA